MRELADETDRLGIDDKEQSESCFTKPDKKENYPFPGSLSGIIPAAGRKES